MRLGPQTWACNAATIHSKLMATEHLLVHFCPPHIAALYLPHLPFSASAASLPLSACRRPRTQEHVYDIHALNHIPWSRTRWETEHSQTRLERSSRNICTLHRRTRKAHLHENDNALCVFWSQHIYEHHKSWRCSGVCDEKST